MIDNLHFVKELGLRSKTALEQGDVEGFARPHARALGAQEEALTSMSNPTSTAGTSWAGRAGRWAASSSALAPEASCCSIPATRVRCARR